MDFRLAALKGEIDQIMSAGPIGLWSNVPATFPFNNETVVFNADGSGLITSWSALSGKSLQTFAWSMEAPGRIVMRYRLTRYGDQVEEDSKEPDDSPELAPVTFGIEVVVQETEIGAWPALVSEGSDCFDCMRSGIGPDRAAAAAGGGRAGRAAKPVVALAHVLLDAREPARGRLGRFSLGVPAAAGRKWQCPWASAPKPTRMAPKPHRSRKSLFHIWTEVRF